METIHAPALGDSAALHMLSEEGRARTQEKPQSRWHQESPEQPELTTYGASNRVRKINLDAVKLLCLGFGYLPEHSPM